MKKLVCIFFVLMSGAGYPQSIGHYMQSFSPGTFKKPKLSREWSAHYKKSRQECLEFAKKNGKIFEDCNHEAYPITEKVHQVEKPLWVVTPIIGRGVGYIKFYGGSFRPSFLGRYEPVAFCSKQEKIVNFKIESNESLKLKNVSSACQAGGETYIFYVRFEYEKLEEDGRVFFSIKKSEPFPSAAHVIFSVPFNPFFNRRLYLKEDRVPQALKENTVKYKVLY